MFYSVAPANRPAAGTPPACDSISCLYVSRDSGGVAPRGYRFAVLVAGHPLLFDSGRQSRNALADLDVGNWLEGANADLRRLNANPAAPGCVEDHAYAAGPAATSFNHLATLATRSLNDVVVAGP